MARVEGVDPEQVSDEYTARVLAAHAKTWGAPLLNHLVYARRPSIFRGARGMWTGIDGSGLIDGKRCALLNRRVASLNGCELRRFYDEDALVQLTAIIGWENSSSKFNHALRIPSQGRWRRA